MMLKKVQCFEGKGLLMLKIFTTFVVQKNSREKILMNILAMCPFFFDRFSIQSLEGKTGILTEERYRYAVNQPVGCSEINNIDVESFFHTLKKAFCAYQPE